ncbi:MAG: hypothetical protein C4320_08715 [Armatimonadota bacterium]
MAVLYSILIGLSVIIAIVFTLLVLLTGKGDAMSGGGGVRTSFKGKASFDDIMSKWTLYIGVSFMALVLVVDFVSRKLDQPRKVILPPAASAPAPAPAAPPPTIPPAASNGAGDLANPNPPSANPPATNGGATTGQ